MSPTPGHAKGRLVETIVAAMHRANAVTVKQNVRMRVIGDGRRTSEIDVLLTGAIAGYPIQIAFECKNEQRIVGTPKINAFIGKLEDVGIPIQQGVFVAANGFTRGAIARAQKVGIRTLTLTGLTIDRTAEAVEQILQSIVHLWMSVVKMTFTSTNSIEPGAHLLMFFNENGDIVGSLPDLIWRKWFVGEIPPALGDHHIVLKTPRGWYQMVDGIRMLSPQMQATVRVTAVVTEVPGSANRQELIDATTGQVTKQRVSATFDPSRASIKVLTSEEALQHHFACVRGLALLRDRTRVPRIFWNGTLWPPSAKYKSEFASMCERGGSPSEIKLDETDPPTIQAMWDSVWDHPLIESVLHARFE